MAIEWVRPADLPRIAAGEVQLWRICVDDVRAAYASALSELSVEEQTRASRFRMQTACAEFVFGRCLLRRLLGGAAGLDPYTVDLRSPPFVKPEAPELSDIDFNVSHSHGMILIALSRAGTVGVDVEYVDTLRTSLVDLVESAAGVLDPTELAELRKATAYGEGFRSFYLAWTRREAVGKSHGQGIAGAASYLISSEELGSVYLTSFRPEEESVDRKQVVQSFEVCRQYVGALATSSRVQIRYFDGAGLFF